VTDSPQATLIGLVLDRSSSMAGYTNDTVAGVNAMLDDQRALPGECRLSLMLFNHAQQVREVATPIADVAALTDRVYAPNGNTALLDSFGMMVDGLGAWVERHGWAGLVKVVVFTDGEENASSQYDRDQLNRMIGEKRDAGWEFIFMGSGGAAWLEGRAMSNVAATSYSVGVGGPAVMDSFAVASDALLGSRTTGVAMAGTFDAAYGKNDDDDPDATPDPKSVLAANQQARRQGFANANAADVQRLVNAYRTDSHNPPTTARDRLAGDEPHRSTVDQLAGD
jgi:hypothetical protein